MEKKRRRGGCLVRLLTCVLLVFILLAACLVLIAYGDEISCFRQVKEYFFGPEIEFQETEGVAEELEKNLFYYDQLAEDDQVIYEEIFAGVSEFNDEIYVHSTSPDDCNQILKEVLLDHPELFWCDGTVSTSAYTSKKEYSIVSPAYNCSKDEWKKRKAQVENTAATWISGLQDGAGDYEKILFIYETIVENVDYDLDASDNQNIYSVFVGRKSVCAGYAKAFSYLADKLGIECIYVTGNTDDGSAHAWNLVKCDGNYYQLDVTWGDPIFLEETSHSIDDNISYDYMLCSDEQIGSTHTLQEGYAYPSCTHMDNNYYVRNGMYYESYDPGEALDAMNQSVTDKENQIVLKYATKEAYKKALDDILNRQLKNVLDRLGRLYGLTRVRYSYVDDDAMNKLTFYWNYTIVQ